jgi:parallel beta-helix repeat protein
MKKRLMILIVLSVIIISIISLIITLPSVQAQCVMPSSNLIIDTDTILCEEAYQLPYSIVIGNSGVTLDCNHATLKGSGFGEGITVIDVGSVTIKNCKIENYENGIYLKNSNNNQITDNELTSNVNGIAIENSQQNSIVDNKISSLEENIVYYNEGNDYEDNNYNEPLAEETTNSAEYNEKEIESEQQEANVLETEYADNLDSLDKEEKGLISSNVNEITIEDTEEAKVEITNNVNKEALNKIVTIRNKDHEAASSLVEIKKTKTISTDNEGIPKTTFETLIKAKEDVKNLVVYEYIPKEIASDASELKFYGNAEIVESDPVLKKEIGDVKKDEIIVITYEVNKMVAGNTDPSTVVTIEGKSRWINILSSISYILAVYIALVIIKRYKADKMLSNLKKRSKKLLGVPLPVAYITLSIIPQINYRLLISENIALIFYITIILLEAIIIKILIKKR